MPIEKTEAAQQHSAHRRSVAYCMHGMAGRNWGKARSLCEDTSLGPGGTGYGGGAGECATTTTSPRPHSDPSKQREPRGRQGNAASLPAAQRSNPVAASLVASFVLVIKRKEKVRGPWVLGSSQDATRARGASCMGAVLLRPVGPAIRIQSKSSKQLLLCLSITLRTAAVRLVDL